MDYYCACRSLFLWRMKPAKGVRSISTAQLKDMLNDKDKIFIDVRTPAEYKGRHISQFKMFRLDRALKTYRRIKRS